MTKARDLANASTALSAVSATELAFVDGVTSAIQTQIDGKQAVNANVSTTELGYLDGVTSAIQTQLDAKTAKSTLTTTGDIYYASAANTPARLGIGTTGQVLNVAGGVPAWATPAGGGKVLQVVYAATSSTVTTSSATWQDTNLTASITPSSATSKVLVLVAQNGGGKNSSDTAVYAKLLRGATDLITFSLSAGNTDSTASNYLGSVSVNYLDSPATTSATTYKTQYQNPAGTGTVRFQGSGTTSTIILMEIGA